MIVWCWRGCSLAVRHWSHKPMVRGSNLALAASFRPWERRFTSISSVHPAVFKLGTRQQAVERSCQSVECIRPKGLSTFLCFPGSWDGAGLYRPAGGINCVKRSEHFVWKMRYIKMDIHFFIYLWFILDTGEAVVEPCCTISAANGSTHCE